MLLTIPSVMHGSFRNEFIRFCLTLSCAAFSYFCGIHFLLRLIAIPFNVVMIWLIEYVLWRELMYQVGCYGKSLCQGEASFGQLGIHKTLLISSGSILEDDKISETWVYVLFARVLVAMFIHYLLLLNLVV